MRTDGMKVSLDDPRGLEIVRAYLEAIEARDLAALKRLLAPGVELFHADYPPVQGRKAVIDMYRGYISIVRDVAFEVNNVLGADNVVFVEKVNVAIGPTGAIARIRVVTVFELTPDALVSSIRLYADTSGLFRRLELAVARTGT